jgi:mRNA-degrading endonuclease RelE of RelBE toxin-antitoxin system
VGDRELLYAPRAQRDLLALPKRNALRIIEDLELLRTPPWPPGKVKKIRGHDFWEIKTGDFRTIFRQQGKKVVILRVVNRRDLEATLGRIDLRALIQWLREEGREDE